MAQKETVEQRTAALLQPILDENGFELVDVEYVKEGSTKYLRAYIDRPGGIRIDDCELVSRALDAALDASDFPDEPYTLEISSPGLLRPFRKDRDFERNVGKDVEIHLYRPLGGQKDFVGVLTAYENGTAVLNDGTREYRFARKDISMARQYIDFAELLKE